MLSKNLAKQFAAFPYHQVLNTTPSNSPASIKNQPKILSPWFMQLNINLDPTKIHVESSGSNKLAFQITLSCF
jgi:hypothetical protein